MEVLTKYSLLIIIRTFVAKNIMERQRILVKKVQ
ncbi:MAG: hypothetical protein K0S31_4306 [Sphingobacterium multivorum]|jgi:hypothetical protein|nr:hypothetical protein [Sphingobacterium multivorum]